MSLVNDLRAERLPVKTYTVADGLLRDAAYKIKQDSRGFLWFCTVEGLSRFDGYGFTNFTTAEGLPDRHANDFLETSAGVYFVATEKGVARLNPTGIAHSAENPLFTAFLPDDPQARFIQVLFEARDRTIWVGTRSGLYRFIESDGQPAFEKFPIGNDSITAIFEDRRGALWVGAAGGKLFRLLPDGRFEQYTIADGLPNAWIVAFFEDTDGRIWAGLRPGENLTVGIIRFVERPAPGAPIIERSFGAADGLPSFWVPSIFQSSDGRMWVGTTKGLCLWRGEAQSSVCRTYTAENGLCDYEVWSLTEDRDGNIWAGTRCGVKKLVRHGFTVYNETDALDSPIISSIFENRGGELFASARRKQLSVSRFDSARFSTVKAPLPPRISYFGWGWKQIVWHDSLGAWWLPTGAGLFRSPPRTDFERLAGADLEKIETGAKDDEVFRLFEDSRGDIWVATAGSAFALWHWNRARNEWRDCTQKAGLSVNTLATVFAEDREGNLWIATGSDWHESRLIRYRDGNFRAFTESDGAPPAWTRDLYVDDAGRLWLANTTKGLLRLDDVNSETLNFAAYTTDQNLSSNGVYCVTGDEFGRIYAGTGRGLDRLTPETGHVENFTTADGLPNSDVEIAYRDREKKLWFATADGLVRYVPEPPRPRKKPTVLITALQTAGQPQPVSILGETQIADLKLAANENRIRVEFIGLGASLGEKLIYEYRVGDDSAPWLTTDERTVNFANLSAGDYRFEVRAATADKIYSDPARVEFTIAAPFWRQGWFLCLLAVFAALAIYAMHRIHVTRLLEIERTRTRIATDLHDDIGTNLSKISLLSEIVNLQLADENGKNKQMLATIAEISRESVASMSDIVWAINPHRDSLQELISRMRNYAEETFLESGVRVRFDAPPESAQDVKLSMDVRRDLFLIFKESVANAAKHARCRNLEIVFRTDRRRVFLQVRDDGRGFDASRKFDGNGLGNLRQRVAAHGGKLSIESKRGGGTVVAVEIPQTR